MGSVAVASAVQAATGFDRCPSGCFCTFTGLDGSGYMAYFHYGSPNLSEQGMETTFGPYAIAPAASGLGAMDLITLAGRYPAHPVL
ncbi:peptidase inhibitor family I36 protein [Micromonospora sp. NPDC005324]|uniref:peptidase inhibitor family I36 protein n=1 Tax=Micromonospora sp. NPDC005324 TaxID=3157033 RepID=UPI0033AE4E05